MDGFFCAVIKVPRVERVRPQMHEMQTIAFDDPIAWVSVCHADNCPYSFARWCHSDVAITILL